MSMGKIILLRGKGADMHIKEMIFMIIGLTVFFSMVLLFYLAFSLSTVKQNVELSSKIGSVLIATSLSGSPEFSCPPDLARTAGICIDADKILALISSHQDYSKLWSNDIAGLRVEKVLTANKTVNCTIGNYDKCTTFMIIPDKAVEVDEYASYASLCRINSENGKTYPDCELAKIIVAAEKRA